MKKIILIATLMIGLLSCTKEKVDNSKCGNITRKALLLPPQSLPIQVGPEIIEPK